MADDTAPVPSAFQWGAGGSRLTPEEIAAQRKVADALLMQAGNTTPFAPGTRGAGGQWTQGLAQIAKGISAGMDYRQLDQASKANDADNKTMIAALLGQGGAPAAAAAPVAAPVAAVAAPGSSASLDPETTGYIKNAADKFGVDPAYLQRTALIESGGKADATNPSGAAGLFQFMPKTAKEYGLDNPLDPEDSAMAAAELAADNRKSLADSLGRNPTNAELYLAHQQGAGGAAALLANPNVPAVQAVGRQAVLQNGGSEDMTSGQFANKWLSKFGGDAAPAPAQVAQANVPPAISQAVARVAGAMPAVPGQAPAPAAVARVAGAMPSDDATALPAGATPTQGYAIPGQPAPVAAAAAPAGPAAVAKVAGGLGNVNPAVLQAMTSPYASASTKQIAGLLLQQQMTPKDVHTQETDKDGNVWDVNNLTKQRTVALKATDTATPAQKDFEYGKTHPDFVSRSVKNLGAGGELYHTDPDGKVVIDHKNSASVEDVPQSTIDFLADRVRMGDPAVKIGYARNPGMIAKIDTTAQQREEAGIPVSDPARNVTGNKVTLSARGAAERKLGTINTNNEFYGNNALGALDIAEKASSDVPRTDYPGVNKAINAYRTQTGDPKTVALGAALNTVVNDYAKFTGGGVGTDSLRGHAEEILNGAHSHEQLQAIVHMMRTEIKRGQQSPSMVREGFDNLYAPHGSATAPEAAPAIAAPAAVVAPPGAAENDIAHNPSTGETIIRKNGKWEPFT